MTFLNRKKERICNAGINSKTSTAFKAGGLLLPVIVVKPKTSIVINTIETVSYTHLLVFGFICTSLSTCMTTKKAMILALITVCNPITSSQVFT